MYIGSVFEFGGARFEKDPVFGWCLNRKVLFHHDPELLKVILLNLPKSFPDEIAESLRKEIKVAEEKTTELRTVSVVPAAPQTVVSEALVGSAYTFRPEVMEVLNLLEHRTPGEKPGEWFVDLQSAPFDSKDKDGRPNNASTGETKGAHTFCRVERLTSEVIEPTYWLSWFRGGKAEIFFCSPHYTDMVQKLLDTFY